MKSLSWTTRLVAVVGKAGITHSEAIYPWFVVLGEHENVPVAYAETAVSLLEKRRS